MYKRIVIDLYDSHNRNVGLGEFTYKVAQGLAMRAKTLLHEHGVKFTFVVHKSMKGAFGPDVDYMVLNNANRLLLRLKPMRVDLLHIPHQFCRLKFMLTARRTLLTIHDINFMYEKSGAKLEKYKCVFARRLSRANALSFISEFSRSDVAANFNIASKTQRVIYNGTTDLTLEQPADISALRLPEGFLFHVSSLLPKKNVHLLVDMMKFLPDENLVIAGDWSSKYAQGLRHRIEQEKITNIYPLENISHATKVALFAKCKAFVFPSLCEGFGLPPIEAMYCGKPVFVSMLTSLPEVCGDNSFYWDILQPEVMAKELKSNLLSLPEGYADLQKARAHFFDWNKCVDAYVDYYLDMLK